MTDKYIRPDSLVGMREKLRQQAEQIADLKGGCRNQKELAEERRVEINRLCDELDSKESENARLKQELNKIKSFEKQRWEHIPAELRGGQDNETT